MKLVIKNYSGENITSLMRKVQYYFQPRDTDEELVFIRPLERSGYPRFHIYLMVDSENNELILNLHLDQKRPIYKGTTAHSGEYEGNVVEQEAERIKQIL